MRNVFVAVIGQSNEAGSGVTPNVNVGFGAPLRDPVLPGGTTGKRSMWPYLAQLLGKRGIWAHVHNTAVGSTSIAESWCGHCRTWANGIKVIAGSYVLSSGGLWRVTDDGSANLYTCTVAPTGTSNLTTADTPTNIPWTYIGVPGANDTDGKVYAEGDARFNPRGLLTAVATGLSAAVGYDEKWAFISLGQADAACVNARATYKQGLINAANYALAHGANKVFIGFTVYSGGAGHDAWYSSDLIPGWQDALTSFVGDSRIKTGANLRTALGVLPINPALPTPGLQSDFAHMNDPAYDLACEAWRDALIAAGSA